MDKDNAASVKGEETAYVRFTVNIAFLSAIAQLQ